MTAGNLLLILLWSKIQYQHESLSKTALLIIKKTTFVQNRMFEKYQKESKNHLHCLTHSDSHWWHAGVNPPGAHSPTDCKPAWGVLFWVASFDHEHHYSCGPFKEPHPFILRRMLLRRDFIFRTLYNFTVEIHILSAQNHWLLMGGD